MNSVKILIVILFVLLGSAGHSMAAPEDMEVTVWDIGCAHTMTTNHFELAPGESVEIPLDLTYCVSTPEGVLFFGYNTTDTKSLQLTRRNKINITVYDRDSGQQWSSDNGYLYIVGSEPVVYVMYVENMNQKKTLKIRLRASAIW